MVMEAMTSFVFKASRNNSVHHSRSRAGVRNPSLFVRDHHFTSDLLFSAPHPEFPNLTLQLRTGSDQHPGKLAVSPLSRCLAPGSQVLAPLPIRLAQVPNSSLRRTWPRPAVPEDDGTRRLSQPRLSRARARSTTSGLAPGLSHVRQNGSRPSFPPSLRDRNSYTGYRGLEAGALPSAG